jgi:glutamate dehydrogenase (NAD(P)+)
MMTVSISGRGYCAHLVIDSIVDNTSSGGVRIADCVPPEEVAALAREMTYKFTSYRLGRGGAKMGISIPSDATPDEKARILSEVGRKLGPIIRAGVYYPGMDINCALQDLQTLYLGAGMPIGTVTDSSYFTALSVESALDAWYEESGCQGTMSLAIEGFGRVAGHLAARLSSSRYKIVAISTLSGAIRNLDGFASQSLSEKRNEFGDEVVKQIHGEAIDNDQVFSEPVDVLIPSSRTWVIDEHNVGQISAAAIVPIANAPFADGTVVSLHDRNVVCLPGFITNAGGVFGTSLYDTGLTTPEVEAMTKSCVQPVIRRLLSLSGQTGVSPVELAERAILGELNIRNQPHTAPSNLARIMRRLSPHFPQATRKRLARKKFVGSMNELRHDFESAARTSDPVSVLVGE